MFTVDDINSLMSSDETLKAAYLDARNAINEFIEQNSVKIEKAIRLTSDVGLVDENGDPFKNQRYSVVSLYKSRHAEEPKPWALNTIAFENITRDAWELIYNLCTDNGTRYTELPHPSLEGEVVYPCRAGRYVNGLKGAALVCRTGHCYKSILFHPKLPKSKITFVHYSSFYGIGNACGCDYEGYDRNDVQATVGRMLWVIWLSKLITEQMSIILDRTEERYDSLIRNPYNSVMINEKFGFNPVEKTHAPKKPFFSRIKELFK